MFRIGVTQDIGAAFPLPIIRISQQMPYEFGRLRIWNPGAGKSSMLWGIALFVLIISIGLFIARFAVFYSQGGLWFDEIFSVWATDPTAPIVTVLVERIGPETNPP